MSDVDQKAREGALISFRRAVEVNAAIPTGALASLDEVDLAHIEAAPAWSIPIRDAGTAGQLSFETASTLTARTAGAGDKVGFWKSTGEYGVADASEFGGKFARSVNTGTSITANVALDSTIQLLRSASAVTVTLAEAGGTNTQIILVKETDQTITVQVGGAAVYRLPGDDDSVSRTASFVLTGSVTLVGDAGTWLVVGETNHSVVWQADIDGNNFRIWGYRNRKYGALSGAQTLNGTNFVNGSVLINTGAAASYTLPSRLTATNATIELKVVNRGSGAITWSASGVTLTGDTGTLAAGEVAVLEWDHDGTTERVNIRATG